MQIKSRFFSFGAKKKVIKTGWFGLLYETIEYIHKSSLTLEQEVNQFLLDNKINKDNLIKYENDCSYFSGADDLGSYCFQQGGISITWREDAN